MQAIQTVKGFTRIICSNTLQIIQLNHGARTVHYCVEYGHNIGWAFGYRRKNSWYQWSQFGSICIWWQSYENENSYSGSWNGCLFINLESYTLFPILRSGGISSVNRYQRCVTAKACPGEHDTVISWEHRRRSNSLVTSVLMLFETTDHPGQ